MKVAILTWATNTNNYGSILQAYSIQSFLKEHNYDNVILDYSPKVSDLQWPCLFEMNRRRIIRKVKIIFSHFTDRKKQWEKECSHCCAEYVKHNLVLSDNYKGVNQIKNTLSEYDTFVCGSDQIWSMKRVINPVYYLTWVSDEKGKIAYAPSLSSETFNKRKREALIKNTKGFDAISVREEKTAREISEILNRDIVSVLDPTLLVGDDFWTSKVQLKENNNKYILCYFLGENKDYKKCVEKVERETGYSVKIIPFNKESFNISGEIQYGVGPNEFLELINNAEVILTDSYHGTIFSVVFEKRFTLFKRFTDGEKADENGRIYDLVEKLDMERQLCETSSFKIDNTSKPNYVEIKKKINMLRTKSKRFLLEALKGCRYNE